MQIQIPLKGQTFWGGERMKKPPNPTPPSFPILGDNFCKVYVYHRFARFRPYSKFPVNEEPIHFPQKLHPNGWGEGSSPHLMAQNSPNVALFGSIFIKNSK